MYLAWFQDCAGVILYAAENATQVALDAIQILGKSLSLSLSLASPVKLNNQFATSPFFFSFVKRVTCGGSLYLNASTHSTDLAFKNYATHHAG